MSQAADLPQLSKDLEGVALGDARLDARAQKLVDDAAREPGKSFPQIYEDDAAALEGLYRFCSNKRVSLAKLHKGHAEATLARCREEKVVLAAHDTSVFSFGKETQRVGLGPVDGGGDGFYGHLTLMMTADEVHRPLGVSAAKVWTRKPVPNELKGAKNRKKRAKSHGEKESARWKEQIEAVEKLAGDEVSVIHVCDREADDYDFLADIAVRQRARFVVRSKHDRFVVDSPDHGSRMRLREKLKSAPVRDSFALELQPRPVKSDQPPKSRKDHPPRSARTAVIEVRAMAVELLRPDQASADLPASVQVNAVWLHEVACPEGEDPVDWLLLTTEPIETVAQIKKIIGYYRGRWRIEEYFKALKSGCAYEHRQLVTFAALTAAMGVFMPIAWRLLLLRTLAREEPEAPATAVLSPRQIFVLAASLKKRKLPEQPTVHDALLGVAALGGHLLHNGAPGWIIISRGYEKLLTLEQGWRAHEDLEARGQGLQLRPGKAANDL